MGHAIAFYIFAVLAVGSALITILHRNIFKSATFLAGLLLCQAALFITLDAEFVAVVQVLVYIGAITILIVFAIMLTMRINDEAQPQFNAQRYLAPVIAVGMVALIVTFLMKTRWESTAPADLPPDVLAAIGQSLISYFIFPFDLVTVLLLVALVGAAYIVKQDDRPKPAGGNAAAAPAKPVEDTEVMVH